MPRLTFSTELAANQQGYDPLNAANWEYRKIPEAYVNGAICKAKFTAEIASSVVVVITSGSQNIQKRSPVTLDATVGNLPADLNVDPVVWRAGPGDQISIEFTELLGGTPFVQGIVDVEPV